MLLFITVILWAINRCAMIGKHYNHIFLYTGLDKGNMLSLLQNKHPVTLPEAHISQLICP